MIRQAVPVSQSKRCIVGRCSTFMGSSNSYLYYIKYFVFSKNIYALFTSCDLILSLNSIYTFQSFFIHDLTTVPEGKTIKREQNSYNKIWGTESKGRGKTRNWEEGERTTRERRGSDPAVEIFSISLSQLLSQFYTTNYIC